MYVGMRYTSTARGSVIKRVDCEHCKAVFFYPMTRTAIGQGSSAYFVDNAGGAERARYRAQDALAERLDKGCEAVRCPGCGKFQANMVKKLKYQRFIVLLWLILLVPTAVLFASLIYVSGLDLRPGESGQYYGGCVALAAAVAIAVWLFRWTRVRAYDPNADPGADRLFPNAPEPLSPAEVNELLQNAADTQPVAQLKGGWQGRDSQ